MSGWKKLLGMVKSEDTEVTSIEIIKNLKENSMACGLLRKLTFTNKSEMKSSGFIILEQYDNVLQVKVKTVETLEGYDTLANLVKLNGENVPIGNLTAVVCINSEMLAYNGILATPVFGVEFFLKAFFLKEKKTEKTYLVVLKHKKA